MTTLLEFGYLSRTLHFLSYIDLFPRRSSAAQDPAIAFVHRSRTPLTAADPLDQAILRRYGSVVPVPAGLRLRSDNGSTFLARLFLSCTKGWGIEQEHTPGYSPELNGVSERFFRTLKQECSWLHEFGSFEEAKTVITRWFHAHNQEGLHSALGNRTAAACRERFYVLPQAA